jgi:peptide/nickel transport system substrate-binding protein
MISSYTPKQDAKGARPARRGRLELVRNPHFHVWSPAAQPDGYPDRIVLDTGYTEKQAEQRVADGRADVIWLTDEPLSNADQLQTQHGSQLRTSTGTATSYVFLNATKPPFKNRDARRAVAYALDRRSLADGRGEFSGALTCQILPSNIVGYRPYCPFTLGAGADGVWTGFDLATAEDLVEGSGTRGARVVLAVAKEDPYMRKAGGRLVDVLRRLGYHASLRSYPLEPDFYDVLAKRTDWDVGVWGWVPDYPAPSKLLVDLAACDPDLKEFNLAGYCDPQIEKAMAAALHLQATDPAGASNAWAAVDRMVVDAAAIIPFSNNLRQDFVNRRVGNTLVHPVTGPLIAQMWVQ